MNFKKLAYINFDDINNTIEHQFVAIHVYYIGKYHTCCTRAKLARCATGCTSALKETL